jgi:molybdopterin molybdotransferase
MTARPTPSARPPLRPLDEAVADLLAQALPLDEVQSIPTFDADGRVLAQDLVSSLDVPGHDNSAMDGYAVRIADLVATDTLAVSQRIPAGSAAQPLAAKSAARIFTGAPVPPGADAVVMQEATEVLPDSAQVRVLAAPEPGQWIRRRGEDVARGAVVLPRGSRLTPASLGLAASIGFAQLTVSRPVRVALFSTGDELVMPGDMPAEQLPAGAIFNSNRFFLRGLLKRLGCEVTDLGIVPDQRQVTIDALAAAAREHDLILTSGGVSVGEEDHIKPAVEALGELMLWQIAIKPGKPFAYGRVRRPAPSAGSADFAHFIGLPGNPVSSFVTFLLLVRPFLLKLQGATDVLPQAMPAVAGFSWPKADKRREFLRVQQTARGGLALFENQSSGVLTSAVWGDGLVDNPPGQIITPGSIVQYIPFSALLS